jgi:hypothetical protein
MHSRPSTPVLSNPVLFIFQTSRTPIISIKHLPNFQYWNRIIQNVHPLRNHRKYHVGHVYFFPLEQPKHSGPSSVGCSITPSVLIRGEKVLSAAQTEISLAQDNIVTLLSFRWTPMLRLICISKALIGNVKCTAAFYCNTENKPLCYITPYVNSKVFLFPCAQVRACSTKVPICHDNVCFYVFLA